MADVATIRAESISLPRRAVAFVVLMIAEFFYGWAWNTVDLLRPQIREALSLSLTQAGSLYSAQSAGALVGAVVMGQVADRFGRRNALFGIMIGYGLTLLAGAFVSTYIGALAQRFALGAALGGIFPVVISIYIGLFPATVRGKLASIGNATFNLSVIALGASLALLAPSDDWRILLWIGGVPPIVLAPLVFVLIPDDRRLIAYGTREGEVAPQLPKLPVAELFRPGLRRKTLLLALMVGINFFAYQAFAGWATVYLKEVRGFTPAVFGSVVSWQFAGSLLGGFFWGWFSDRYGRRPASAGFFAGSLVVFAYLTLLTDPDLLRYAGFAFGFAIACSVAWAPWMAEIFPPHLRATALSIFQWGRIISFFAPLITGVIAEQAGLAAAMMLSAVGFFVAGAVWLMLPETLKRPVADQSPSPAANPA